MRTAAKRNSKRDTRSRATRTAERRQALKEVLIAAAERKIAAEGLARLNARELTGEVGCALGAIYNVFPDLDAIVYEVNSRTLALFEAFLVARGWPPPANGDDDEAAIAELVGLAGHYLDFAIANRPRWRALFEHRQATPDAKLPDWYLADQRRMFAMVEKPLATLRPELNTEERESFARTMVAAAHGVVSIGLDEKLMPLPLAALGRQVRKFVEALCRGLVAGRE